MNASNARKKEAAAKRRAEDIGLTQG